MRACTMPPWPDMRTPPEGGVFAGRARVDRVVLVHHRDHPGDKVVHVAEGARLAPRAVQRDRLPLQRLNDEVRHHAAVVRVHPRADRVHVLPVRLRLWVLGRIAV